MCRFLQQMRRWGAVTLSSLLLLCAAPAPADAAHGDCGQPVSDGTAPNATDCLAMLRVSIGLGGCEPPCICDVNGTATVTAADALQCLKRAIGQSVALDCLCNVQSTTTIGPTSTSSLLSSTTTGSTVPTTLPVTTTTLLGEECPDRLELLFLAGVRGHCATNDDCARGSCDESLGRCVTDSELDLGWTGRLHDADVDDSAQIVTAFDCSGSASACGECTIGALDASAGNCRCANDNRKVCNEPFGNDLDDCEGSVCNCYFGPPLPLSAGSSPLCLVNRLTSNVTGTFDPDAGNLTLDLALRSTVFSGNDVLAPCPSCGGRCLEPEERRNFPCIKSSDCNTEDEAGECGGFDEIANDGVRAGLCVGGPNAGFGCDINGFNTTFPAPGGSAYSLDCFPPGGQNVSGQGLPIALHQTTAPQSLESNVECGFPPVVTRSCPCGVCNDISAAACTSNEDCAESVTCVAPAGSALPNACDDEVCTVGENGEGSCLGGPIDKFCDQLLRANGRGLLPCQTNVDCEAETTGFAAGACTLQAARACYPSTLTSTGTADPRNPTAGALTCIPPSSNDSLNDTIGLPGAARFEAAIIAKGFCAETSRLYAPGQGCK